MFHNHNLLPSQVNVCYNRARVVLNIHQEHQHSGANPRVFEICGSGAYQICDSNPYVRALFPGGGIGLYEDREQLFALIDDALASPKDSEASAARETVLAGHTFVDRIGTVLDAFHFETKIVEL